MPAAVSEVSSRKHQSDSFCRPDSQRNDLIDGDEEEEEEEEILGSDDDEQEDPRDYCKGQSLRRLSRLLNRGSRLPGTPYLAAGLFRSHSAATRLAVSSRSFLKQSRD